MEWTEKNPDEPIAFLIDEARFAKTTETISPYLDMLLRFSNRKNLDIIFTAHRPVDIAVGLSRDLRITGVCSRQRRNTICV